jgi:hypothetical protein
VVACVLCHAMHTTLAHQGMLQYHNAAMSARAHSRSTAGTRALTCPDLTCSLSRSLSLAYVVVSMP